MKKKEEYLVDPNFFGTLREGLLDGEPITVAIEEIGPAMLAQLALDGPVQLEFKEPGSFARVSPPPSIKTLMAIASLARHYRRNYPHRCLVCNLECCDHRRHEALE